MKKVFETIVEKFDWSGKLTQDDKPNYLVLDAYHSAKQTFNKLSEQIKKSTESTKSEDIGEDFIASI